MNINVFEDSHQQSSPLRHPNRKRTKKAPSSDPRKNRINACPDDDYVATRLNDEGELICDDGTKDMYHHKSKFDESINKKSSFPKGVWCCETDKIPSSQYNKGSEALERKRLLFLKEYEENKKKPALRAASRLSAENRSFRFQVPPLPINHPKSQQLLPQQPQPQQQPQSHPIPNPKLKNNSSSSNSSNNSFGEMIPGEWDVGFITPPGVNMIPDQNMLPVQNELVRRKRSKKSSRSRSKRRSRSRRRKRRRTNNN
jgi:hypothetical protein